MSNPEQKDRRLAVRVGIFVAITLLLAGIVILLIGQEQGIFQKSVNFHGAFENVDGLKLDSPVRLGGLDVGRVSGITFAPDLGDKRIRVQMDIGQKFGERVRADSVARVTGRGVLGDKAIDISLGSAEAARIPNGGEIPTGSSGDISSLLKASGEIVDNAVVISRDLRQVVAGYSDPKIRDDIASTIASVSAIANEIRTGQGTFHALVYDPKTTQEFKVLLTRIASTATRLDGAVGQAETFLKDAREGNGAIHALIYDKKGAQLVTELGAAAGEVAGLIRDAKASKNGAVHQLVYGDSKELFSNLGGAAADLKAVTGKIRSGDGTVGGLINDPTVYESLREILGNIKRNRILRALVRLSISNGENLEAVGQPDAKK